MGCYCRQFLLTRPLQLMNVKNRVALGRLGRRGGIKEQKRPWSSLSLCLAISERVGDVWWMKARDKDSFFCRWGSGLCEMYRGDKEVTSSKDGWALDSCIMWLAEPWVNMSPVLFSFFFCHPSRPSTAQACVISLRDTHQSARAALIRLLRAESHNGPIGLSQTSSKASPDVYSTDLLLYMHWFWFKWQSNSLQSRLEIHCCIKSIRPMAF